MEQLSAATSSESGWIRAASGAPILRYEVELEGPLLHVEWQDGQLLDDVKAGFLAVTQLLHTHGCTALLSDSNDGSGDWSELIPWVRYEFLPLAITNGLRYLADVQPYDPANSFSVHKWREQTRGLLHHGVFPNLTLAREWVLDELRKEKQA